MVKSSTMGQIFEVLLIIVIALGLVSTVATSTSSASTALAPFTGAQGLVIIVPLLFVAIILFAAYKRGVEKQVGAWIDLAEQTLRWAVTMLFKAVHDAYVASLPSSGQS